MTSTQWFVISVPKDSSSVTFPLLAAGLTGAGRDQESSAQSPGGLTGTDATITTNTMSAVATGGTVERDIRPEKTHRATTEPNNNLFAMLGADHGP